MHKHRKGVCWRGSSPKYLGIRERDRDRETKRDRETETERETKRQKQRERLLYENDSREVRREGKGDQNGNDREWASGREEGGSTVIATWLIIIHVHKLCLNQWCDLTQGPHHKLNNNVKQRLSIIWKTTLLTSKNIAHCTLYVHVY